jgi:3-phosphoshikimate 1-carboxyvinyltransferase
VGRKISEVIIMEHLDLSPLKTARGIVRLPGSKSISNRTLLLAALSEGTTDIRDLLASDDTDRMLEALALLGVSVQKTGERDYRVIGAPQGFANKNADLFLGNAGTAFRPLTAALALAGGSYKLHGVPRMHERPIGDLVDGLRQIGAQIDYLGNEGFPPLQIRPASITPGGVVRIRGNVSSQFLTALLMALPTTGVETTVEVVGELISKPYIEITLRLMAQFGVEVRREGWQRFIIPGGKRYVSPGTVFVEGDASSASYFLAAGAIGGGPLRVEGVGRNSIQGDVAFASALEKIGAQIAMGENWIEASAPIGGALKAFDMDFNHIPDAAMTLAVAALFVMGLPDCAILPVGASRKLTGFQLWRRSCASLARRSRRVKTGCSVTPPAQLTPNASIDTYDDHRMAMCFSLVALGGVPVRINDPKCTAKTFPDYFDVFASVTN